MQGSTKDDDLMQKTPGEEGGVRRGKLWSTSWAKLNVLET